MSSGSLLLLELIISVVCREEEHIREETILNSLAKFISRYREHMQMISWSHFINSDFEF